MEEARHCKISKDPISKVLLSLLKSHDQVLEVGTGNAQHATYIGRHLPNIVWQCSDKQMYFKTINDWLKEHPTPNVLHPVHLEVGKTAWPDRKYDLIFTANTLHLMSLVIINIFFEQAAKILAKKGFLCLYGPFNYRNDFTRPENKLFYTTYKTCDSQIYYVEDLYELAKPHGFILKDDYLMPENNSFLIFKKG